MQHFFQAANIFESFLTSSTFGHVNRNGLAFSMFQFPVQESAQPVSVSDTRQHFICLYNR